MNTSLHIDNLESLLIAIGVLFIGYFINSRISVLSKYNIPEPIVGGVIVSALIAWLHHQGVDIQFQLDMKNTLMLMFFTSIGLAANFKLLAKGGAKVFLFLGLATGFILLQNGVGVLMAKAMGLDPLLGLIGGSITLSGGHGTGAAWAEIFQQQYGLPSLELAMASATFGLVMGGLVGGPVARQLIQRHGLSSSYGAEHNHHLQHPDLVTFDTQEEDRITARNSLEVLFIMLLCVAGSHYIQQWVSAADISWLKMPGFVYALFMGVLVTNLCDVSRVYRVNKETVDALGTIALSLFLAMALMSLKLWQLMDLALPMLLILLTQTVLMVLFAYLVTFRLMGRNYDAAILAGGHCGFGLGATPTAVMNMGSLVTRYGPSPQAFIIVPIVGAFFIDLANLAVLQGFLGFLR